MAWVVKNHPDLVEGAKIGNERCKDMLGCMFIGWLASTDQKKESAKTPIDYTVKLGKKDKPTHQFDGNLFHMKNDRIWIWSNDLNKWQTLWGSNEHANMLRLLKKNPSLKINPS